MRPCPSSGTASSAVAGGPGRAGSSRERAQDEDGDQEGQATRASDWLLRTPIVPAT
ncbi:hypothetical protein GNZ18_23910 [Actinomadura sp. NEAU-AAG5]|uniref:Uncharacterized protein n=1 Tax=Actinomadura litoris TaxID=2678616 RepID=A0A7K1L5C0_9ACTN|nr:hypothetical protein [Actinomadura litoris]